MMSVGAVQRLVQPHYFQCIISDVHVLPSYPSHLYAPSLIDSNSSSSSNLSVIYAVGAALLGTTICQNKSNTYCDDGDNEIGRKERVTTKYTPGMFENVQSVIDFAT